MCMYVCVCVCMYVCNVIASGFTNDCDPSSNEARAHVDSYCRTVNNIKTAIGQFHSKTYKICLFSAVMALNVW